MRSRIKRVLKRALPAAALESLAVAYWRLRNALPRGYERERERLGDFVGPGDWVVDIGVNMGQYASRLARLVGPQGRVIGFEASPATFRLTRRLVRQPQVELHGVALGARAGTVSLGSFVDDSGMVNHGITRVLATADAASAVEPVRCAALDEVLAARPRPIRFVKCDVEGYEVEVLSGAAGVIAQDTPTLLIEIQDAGNHAALRAALEPLGYRIYQLDAAGRWLPSPTYAGSWTNNFLFDVRAPQ